MDKTLPTIGKDVIESLTLGMYEDCRFIYREYIQNSADQIDKAISQGLIKNEEGNIFISIDSEDKSIEIEDNATGIEAKMVLSILQNIAQSTKIRGVDKGFRGIGRLGGLGYCESLIFETSFKGEAKKSIMTWDAKLLKEIINDRNVKENAVEVIGRVTKIVTEKEEVDKHYFKVILKNVTNSILLDIKEIEDYLSMVAPVKYDRGFIFKSKIYEFIKKENFLLDEYNIFINSEPLLKCYTTTIYSENNGCKKKADEIFDIKFFQENSKDGEVLYWGWYGISSFVEQIKKCNNARGFRLRKNNIQIGSESTLVKLFREQRGNFYFFGEVHGVHPDLIPNSRRDYFSENRTLHEFEKKFKEFCHTVLHSLYYKASEIRNAERSILDLVDFQKEYQLKEDSGFINKEEKAKYSTAFEAKKQKAIGAKKKLERIKDSVPNAEHPLNIILGKVSHTETIDPETIEQSTEDKKTIFVTDKYSWLPKNDRKLISRIFGIIETVLPKDVAQNLLDKIDEELRR